MGNLFLEVVTPEKVVVSQEVDMVVAPGSEGEFGILPGHVLFLTGILPGEMRYSTGPETVTFAVTSGFAEVSDNKVSILVDAAEKGTEVDIERARQAEARARERLTKGKGYEDIDYGRAEAALKRALARIKVAEKVI